MVQGKKKISIEEIMEKIVPYYVFKMYMPWDFEINKRCRSPFSAKDVNPSFIIGNKFGVLTFKAFNSENRGDHISFVAQLYNISYREAVLKIATDFGIIEGGEKYNKIIQSFPEIPKTIKIPNFIQVKAQKWTNAHTDYFKAYNLTKEDLNFANDTKVYAVREWALNRSKMPLKLNEVAFAYNLVNEHGNWVKIYRPTAPKRYKWTSSIPFTELHNKGAIGEDCHMAILTKSIKDGAWINKYITKNVEILQAEDICALTVEDAKRIKSCCSRLFIAFDNDKKGKEASISLTRELDCFHINVPDKMLELGVTDFSDWVKATDNQTVVDFFRQKQVI